MATSPQALRTCASPAFQSLGSAFPARRQAPRLCLSSSKPGHMKRVTLPTCLTRCEYHPEIIACRGHKVASGISKGYLGIFVCQVASCRGGTRTTTPRTTSPPRKQSPIFTRSFSVARTSCVRTTPMNSSPAGSGTPSTTPIDMRACTGDSRVTVPSTTDPGDGA